MGQNRDFSGHTAAYAGRQKDSGLSRVSVWVPTARVEEIKQLAKRWREGGEEEPEHIALSDGSAQVPLPPDLLEIFESDPGLASAFAVEFRRQLLFAQEHLEEEHAHIEMQRRRELEGQKHLGQSDAERQTWLPGTEPEPKHHLLKIGRSEKDLIAEVRAAGGYFWAKRKGWVLREEQVATLGLRSRIKKRNITPPPKPAP